MEAKIAEADFWNNPAAGQGVMRELTRLREQVGVWQTLGRSLADTLELAELDDEALREELSAEVERLSGQVELLEFQTLMSGEYDDENAILAIHAGAGGTEAQDWAHMLQRMFIRWAEQHRMTVEVLDTSAGDEAGIKSCMMSVTGRYAYGWLKSERGVHRLVRISPYDGSSRRHTSFAKVEAWPDVAEEIEIEIDERDLRIDRFRASGAGGQHVQKNETAVRITHVPTGLVVSCQNQRSLTQNTQVAMNILKAQLFDLARRNQTAEIAALKGEDVDAAWGSQIRSYVLQPYKMVKDHRTGHEVGNTQAVLDGRLDGFMEAFLRHSVGQGAPATEENTAIPEE
ncbi:Peptide chain release factor 2 [Candidatus Promineifilum breve]|uniref:Peptide chain release factor 2 n=1 Tax=Candidatus Promineifilum breve TaxID=1806508 RepID=A0A160T2D8_9CHLR|nr:Peptide chain release factor 2 [Candidatus Promineifilum breve]